MIRLENVTMAFPDHTAVRRVSFAVEKGETLAVIGGSGSGKSTLLRLMIGLIRPTEGKIWIGDREISAMEEAELDKVRLRMGMVFQYSALFDSMTVGENVAFGLREHTKLKEAEIAQIVREKLHLVGLDGIEKKMPDELSGGMKKRVSLARAIAIDPEIILYDEPSSGLDPIMTGKIDELILETQRRLGVTSVVVTHDMASACHVADRIAMLDKGELIALDTAKNFRKSADPRIKAFFRAVEVEEEEAGL
ncbi:ABC transporter ATP-binding protein [Selenomonas sputigena]|uniref:ABC transporter ATP-binding protein n=1 Tax=Selenomonas sputigena TaxID=69823 RepID=A0ABV3X3I4_9FIRM